jgi:ABC-type Fe3+-hydroxamate transport system substrate-binding protein
MNRKVKVPFPPLSIVSLVPSLTEYLWDLGLQNRISGRTRFCIHPPALKSVCDIGGTKKLNIEKILALKPCLIVGNKEENEKAQIEELEKHAPVWMSDIQSTEDMLETMLLLGNICGRTGEAESITERIRSSFDRIRKASYSFSGKTVLYLIWRNPWMAAGKNTFIDEVLRLAGLKNVVCSNRYPVLSMEDMKSAGADYVLLSSEPYPFGQKHREELIPFFPGSKVLLADGEMFSWYGSRLLHLENYLLRWDAKEKSPEEAGLI